MNWAPGHYYQSLPGLLVALLSARHSPPGWALGLYCYRGPLSHQDEPRIVTSRVLCGLPASVPHLPEALLLTGAAAAFLQTASGRRACACFLPADTALLPSCLPLGLCSDVRSRPASLASFTECCFVICYSPYLAFVFITLPPQRYSTYLLSGCHHKNRNFPKAGTSCLFYSPVSSTLELRLWMTGAEIFVE